MRTVILAGGMGTRFAEETDLRPKPMIEIGGRPLLWHIMKRYERFGFSEFLVALGYKGDAIKSYFRTYHDLRGSMTVDLASGRVEAEEPEAEHWLVQLRDTGEFTNTGGRVRRLRPWLADGTFMLTYGDGLADVDLQALLRFHRESGRIATITAVRPPARFGALVFDGDAITRFREKAPTGEEWINGGFMVFEPGLFDYLDADGTSLEVDALERLAADGQLVGYRHEGFWRCVDTLNDKRVLERLWQDGERPWLV
ncbi:MAG TPA: glucose-1-phosphate cytidylyltransferase [Solirubrobacteraceae bacterium]|nr:glucose-1-phosphate cytidylyltransferase [Solirubrobacteraceae bacterium]